MQRWLMGSTRGRIVPGLGLGSGDTHLVVSPQAPARLPILPWESGWILDHEFAHTQGARPVYREGLGFAYLVVISD